MGRGALALICSDLRTETLKSGFAGDVLDGVALEDSIYAADLLTDEFQQYSPMYPWKDNTICFI